MLQEKTAWILVDAPKIGSLNQCLGLAHTLGYTPIIKKVSLNFPYNYLSPLFRKGILKYGGVDFHPPYPDLIIASGRQAAGPAAALKKLLSSTRTKTIFILNPYISPKHFDAVIVPRHDNIEGDNVCCILGGLHGLTHEKVIQAGSLRFGDVQKPVISVLIGGDSQHFTYTHQTLDQLKKKLLILKNKMRAKTFLITPSRRTRPELLTYLREIFKDDDAFIWDFTGENPYHGMLGAGDVIVATSDSIAMSSEACGVGKPVLIEDLSVQHPKFMAFYNDLFSMGYAHTLDDAVSANELPPTKPLNEMEKVVAFLKAREII